MTVDEAKFSIPTDDGLSRDPAVVDAYLADPLRGFLLTPASTASIYARAGRTADGEAYRGMRKSLPLAVIAAAGSKLT